MISRTQNSTAHLELSLTPQTFNFVNINVFDKLRATIGRSLNLYLSVSRQDVFGHNLCLRQLNARLVIVRKIFRKAMIFFTTAVIYVKIKIYI